MTNSERINNTSKRDQRIARERATAAFSRPAWLYDDIYAAYSRPSFAKVRAWEYCKRLCAECNGWGLAIASKNSMVFTAVFQFEGEDGKPAVAYITRDYDRFAYAD